MNFKRGFHTLDAARYLGVSKSLLDHSRLSGFVADGIPAPPFIKIGRTIRYLKEDLDQWLDLFPKYRHTSAMPERVSDPVKPISLEPPPRSTRSGRHKGFAQTACNQDSVQDF